MTTAVESLSAKQALKLWELLRQHFVNAARVIEEIVETQAWEPLGYTSFAEAWTAQMGEVTLAKEVRPHVVYQLFAENLTDDEIAKIVKGIGPDSSRHLREQRARGVPASMSLVQQHIRRKRSAPSTIHLDVGEHTLREYQEIAQSCGFSVEELAMRAVKESFDRLARERKGN